MPRRRNVGQWRWAVIESTTLTPAAQVLLLLMSEHMDKNRHCTVRRADLAATLKVHPQRVAERVAQAVARGYLVRVRGGTNGRVVTYEGSFPDDLSVPILSTQGVRTANRYADLRSQRTGERYAYKYPVDGSDLPELRLPGDPSGA